MCGFLPVCASNAPPCSQKTPPAPPRAPPRAPPPPSPSRGVRGGGRQIQTNKLSPGALDCSHARIPAWSLGQCFSIHFRFFVDEPTLAALSEERVWGEHAEAVCPPRPSNRTDGNGTASSIEARQAQQQQRRACVYMVLREAAPTCSTARTGGCPGRRGALSDYCAPLLPRGGPRGSGPEEPERVQQIVGDDDDDGGDWRACVHGGSSMVLYDKCGAPDRAGCSDEAARGYCARALGIDRDASDALDRAAAAESESAAAEESRQGDDGGLFLAPPPPEQKAVRSLSPLQREAYALCLAALLPSLPNHGPPVFMAL